MPEMLLAKPSGVTYEQHIKDVCEEGNYIFYSFPFVFEKYQRIVQKDLKKRLDGSCKFHDTGKKHLRWQGACQKDYQIFLDWKIQNDGKGYKEYSKAMKGNTAPYLLKANIRHEIASLVMHKKDNFSLPVMAAIAAHHSKLNEKHEAKWKNKVFEGHSFDLWKYFKSENNRFTNQKFDFNKAVETLYEFSGVRSLLQLADHRASAKEDCEPVQKFESFTYKFPHAAKRSVQELVAQYWKEDLLLIRAPTGAGKTDASLLWAQLQVANKRADRLVIAMPTRFTSNALAISTAESLSSTGLYHSSAWYSRYGSIDYHSPEFKIAKYKHELARLLLTSVTVCTIDHLLMALTLTREDHHSVAFNLANSCVVIDEADFYDDFTQANILVLLQALKIWKVPVLLMSASLPDSSLKHYELIGYKNIKIHEDTSDILRIRCRINEIRKYDKTEDVADLLRKCIEKKSAIIYVNTVEKAIKFYRWFMKNGVTPIIYHSRFTEPDKMFKEEVLIKSLGKDAWKAKRASGIAILTQIGEMSVNISADIMISDLCPIDRLIQRAGRLCRFDKTKIGDLYIINPQKSGKSYPAPYGSYNLANKIWEPVKPYEETEDLIDTKEYSAQRFVEVLNKVYSETIVFSTKSEKNADRLRELFVANWLVGSVHFAKEDDTENDFWKSRDIIGSETVFVQDPSQRFFKSWRDFQAFKNDKSIDIPRYMIEQGLKSHKIHSDFRLMINEEEKTIYCLYPDVYNSDIGLIIESDNSFEDNFL